MSMPYLLSIDNDRPNFDKIIKYNWVPLFLYAIVFYTNYFFLIEKYWFQKKGVQYFLSNLALFSVLILMRQTVFIQLLDHLGVFYKSTNRPSKTLVIYWNTLSLFVPLIFSIALKMGERWSKLETERKEVENTKLQSEIQHLKYQLQPHFFFNSLNNIYSLVDLYPEQAKTTIHALGKLMRYLLYESNTEKVELRKEVEFLEKYIELMNLRTAENVSISKEFDKIDGSIKIAPLLFISLIENSFKHGVSAMEDSPISFQLTVEDGWVKFHSSNANFAKTSDDKSGSGIGLDNLQKRLNLLYPNKHHFQIQTENNQFSTILEIDTKA